MRASTEPTVGAFEERLPDMLADVERLVTCESPSGDPEAVARSAETVAETAAAHLGVEAERVVLDGCTHLRWRFGPGPARVLLLGHHDTVWPLGSLAAHPCTVEDGTLRGPGCFDMKVGLVQLLAALGSLPALDSVSVLVTGDEELGAPTSRQLIEQEVRGVGAVLVLEASADGGALKTARKGVSTYRLLVRGRAAHAGLEPQRGANAGIVLARQVLRVAGLGDPELGTTVTPTVLAAGTTANTVPDSGSLAVDVRAPTISEQRRVDRELRDVAPAGDGTRVEVRGGPDRPPLEPAMSGGLYGRAQRLAAGLGIGALAAAHVGGGSDGNITAGMGIPTLDGLGAVGGGAHADDEHVDVAAIPARTALLAALVSELQGNGR